MNALSHFARKRERNRLQLSRRTLLGAGATLPLLRRGRAHAQASGEISIGYDGSSDLLAGFIESTKEAVGTSSPAATINLQPAPGSAFTTQLFLALSAGNAPDLFLFSGAGIGEFAAAGYLASLDTYLESWDGWEQYADRVKESLRFAGQTFALPSILDTHFLYFRRDRFEAAGLDPNWAPQSPDDILAAARDLKSADDVEIPYALYAGANGGNSTVARGFLPLVYGYGGTLQQPDGRIVIDSCAIRDTLDHYATAYQVDETAPSFVMTDSDPPTSMRAALGDGDLAILHDGCWVYGPWQENDLEDAEANVAYIQFPMVDGSKFSVGGIGASWYINAKSANPDLAWEFIATFNTQQNQVAINSTDPHLPPRRDAQTDPVFQESPFLTAIVDTADTIQLGAPDPALRNLIPIVQNATGIVATGEATPDEAVVRYQEEVTRLLGEDKVVAEPCPQ